MPVAYVPHAGGPVGHVEMGLPPAEVAGWIAYWQSLRALPPCPPKAVLVISAHWEAPVPTVMSAAQPALLFDYGGFPPEAYRLRWPAPGDPALAARVGVLLNRAGFNTAEDPLRGYDHGTFVPLKFTYPDAAVPVVQLSLIAGLDPYLHIRLGRALAPLRDEGVFLVGSGDSFHNLRGFQPSSREAAEQFDAWLSAAVTAPAPEREARLVAWSQAPFARHCHPREEHLLPLMVMAGAAGDDAGQVSWRGPFMGLPQTGYHFA
ncbi:dioxygenase [Inhella sp. 4Y17]|uniref:Dioxygenase n=2 Tax=Inhella gelatinilytica TaxID=2795030 RepID=A0A931ISY5_9BURK|nr:dioxygenase [Inhella gelatinilytica]